MTSQNKRNVSNAVARMRGVLAAHGIAVNQSAAREIAAAALGYRSSNEMGADPDAAAIGDVETIGSISVGDGDLVIVRDVRADGLYALDAKEIGRIAAGDRSRMVGISPYGGLVDLSKLGGKDAAKKLGHSGSEDVHVAIVDHRHGRNVYVDRQRDGLTAQIAGYVEENWNEARAFSPSLPASMDGMDDQEAVDAYFAAHPEEDLEVISEVAAPSQPGGNVRQTQAKTGGRFVIGMVGEDGTSYWTDEGWGELHSAIVHADMQGRLPTAGIDADLVAWYQLPEAGRASRASVEPTMLENRAIAAIRRRGVEISPGCVMRDADVVPGEDGTVHRIVLHHMPSGDIRPIAASVERMAETLKTADARAWLDDDGVHLELPSCDLAQATSVDDWLNAIDDLVTPTDGRPRIIARFTPEAWLRDNAIEVDPQGDVDFDVTYELLLIGRDVAERLASQDSDHLRDAIRAPQWIRDWSGPYTIRAAAGVQAYYGK